eukprot:TRINITY_DN24292_c0_g1_i1.p1 TRINITY_DN24292_c0_g1~~TRINITY_DN24292_c0_g1_i1.p1  ORF type:complete len:106 (-),score=18.83 TRINITY_DN24292_c0_g1_i1:32-349(-)
MQLQNVSWFCGRVKGLTVKTVIYVPFFRADGTTPLVSGKHTVSRTSPYYKAISRSSCEVKVLQIVLNDQMLSTLGISVLFSPQRHKETVDKYNQGKSRSPVTKRR